MQVMSGDHAGFGGVNIYDLSLICFSGSIRSLGAYAQVSKNCGRKKQGRKMKARQDRDETNIFARGDDLLEEEKEP